MHKGLKKLKKYDMIPKVIHYCWFGGKPKPSSVINNISTWKKHLPDYEIVEWNEDNFFPNESIFAKEAYDAKKYAFVADYCRLYVLYNCGGIYFDTDVEVVKPFNDFEGYDFFIGLEMDNQVGTSVIGSKPYHPLVNKFLDYYHDRHFIREDGSYDRTPNTVLLSKILRSLNFSLDNEIFIKNNIAIFPVDYFSPKNLLTLELELTTRTHSIHHFTGSWQSPLEKIKYKIKNYINRIL